jgi:hypothetical protein
MSKRNDNVAGVSNRDCQCVFECLVESLEDALGDNTRCRKNNRNEVRNENSKRRDCWQEWFY